MVQKKMLLYTLRDLYNNFIHDYKQLTVLPSLSYFASLKPRECVHAGDPGTHTICVCEYHENVKLKLAAVSNELHYRDLMELVVCSVENSDCMLHRCSNCPGIAALEVELSKYSLFSKVQEVTFQSWQDKGSRSHMETLKQPIRQFKTDLCDDFWNLTQHHFIADAQKTHFKHVRNNLSLDTAVIVMDFSENFAFVIQNSVQAFYYNNDSATIHPFLMYYKVENEDSVKSTNFCVISDTSDHQAFTVHAFMEKLTNIIKSEYPWIKKIIYFSDGAPSQYKNK